MAIWNNGEIARIAEKAIQDRLWDSMQFQAQGGWCGLLLGEPNRLSALKYDFRDPLSKMGYGYDHLRMLGHGVSYRLD